MTKTFFGGVAVSTLALSMAFTDIALAQTPTVEIGGRLMLDYTIADLDGPDGEINGSEVRRARFHAKGKFSDTISYKFEVNKTGDDAFNMEDAYLEFKPASAPVKIRVGQDNTTNSMDELTSSRFTSTIERGAFTDAFAFGRRLGVTVLYAGENYTLDAGVYTENLEASSFDKEGRAASARATFTPIKTDEMTVHLGASARYTKAADDNDPASSSNLLRYRQRPFTHTTSNRIVSTNRFAKSDTFFGAEAAVLKEGFWAHGEYGVLSANGEGANEDADFSGGFIEAGYFIGGKRTYKGGVFNRPKVDNPVGKGGTGAFAVVARYDTLDLDDGPYDQKLDTIILGADWYPTTHTRLGVNYFNSDADNGNFDSAEGVVARLYFDF